MSGIGRPRPFKSGLPAGRLPRLANVDLTPLPWSDFFDRELFYSSPAGRSGKYHCYSKGDLGETSIILLHGGGYSGLSFGLLAESLVTRAGPNIEILAIDLRGHGSTDADEGDLNLHTFADDVIAIINAHFAPLTVEWPAIVLVGHSLGGAIAVDVAHKLPNCAACILLDITESNAVDNLSGMQALLRSRPTCFPSVKAAIYWALDSKTCTNIRAARVSVPGMIKNEHTGVLAADEVYLQSKQHDTDMVLTPDSLELPVSGANTAMGVLAEDSEEDADECNDHQSSNSDGKLPASTSSTVKLDSIKEGINSASTSKEAIPPKRQSRYIWRIDLSQTERFWAGWFDQMSHLFVTTPTQARLLILAGSTAGLDRDAEMLKGQIMGKFMHEIIPKSGHMVHENEPDLVAMYIIRLLKRHRLLSALASDDDFRVSHGFGGSIRYPPISHYSESKY